MQSDLKRLELFELEDHPRFPDRLRVLMTRYIAAFHRMLGTAGPIAELAAEALRASGRRRIVDLCSGQGGPQLDVLDRLRAEQDLAEVELTLSDRYPPRELVEELAGGGHPGAAYRPTPLDASTADDLPPGLRTMICSLHHMPPEAACAILGRAARDREPFLAFEISDNSSPRALWWTAIPFAALITLFVTPRVRPMSAAQLLLTYLIPVVPLCVGWDGAVSNARTYGLADLERLLAEVPSEGYRWTSGTVGKGPSKQLYLLGIPEH